MGWISNSFPQKTGRAKQTIIIHESFRPTGDRHVAGAWPHDKSFTSRI